MRAHTAATSISPPLSVAKRAASGVAVAALVTSGLALGAGTAQAASFTLADAQNPDFGPNVTIFDSSMTASSIQTQMRAAATAMAGDANHWSSERKAFFFKPGNYGSVADPIQSEIGYYTTVAGLGQSPDSVTINGSLSVEQELHNTGPGDYCSSIGDRYDSPLCKSPGSLNNFWRGMSNLSIDPVPNQAFYDAGNAAQNHTNSVRWAVSQAAPLRRIHIKDDANAAQLLLIGQYYGYASGGFMASSKVDGEVYAAGQQQWYTRDSDIHSWNGSVWNMVFSGVNGGPADDYPDSAENPNAHDATNKYANYGNTPISRDAPFLTWDAATGYSVFVPDARTNAAGVQWTPTSAGAGVSRSLNDFVVFKPGNFTATAANSALAAGKHLLFTPGQYSVSEALNVTKPDTVILGLGLATLRPSNGNAVITVGDVSNVSLSGLMLEPTTNKSKMLVQVGPRGATVANAAKPTTLSDIFIRVGGAQYGSVETAIEINSPNTQIDNIWSWRADHGFNSGVGQGYQWSDNQADTGLRVNGANVTALGLFVEHYQKSQTVWNGENGRTIFYQNELPYEPATQAEFSDRGRDGYAAYKVDPSVANHELFGAGVYSYFRWVDNVWSETAISVPKKSTVKVRRVVTRWLNGCVSPTATSTNPNCTDGLGGGIRHLVNDQGGSANSGPGLGDAAKTKWMREYNSSTGDLTKPTLSLTGSAPGAALTQITAAASDGGGTPANQIHIDYKVGNSLWYPANGTVITPPNGENITVYVRAVDLAGNVSDFQTWTGTVNNPGNPGELDPGTPGGGNNGGGNNGGGNNGGGDNLPPGSGTDPKNPGQGTNPNGTLTIGTKLSAKIRVTPTKASGNKGWHRKAVTLAASGTLEAGKAGFLQIKVGSAAWRTYTGPAKVTTNGKKVVLQARVVSGTTVSPVDSATVKIDTKKPTKLKVKVLKKKKKGAKVLRLSATDKTSKIAKIQYKVNAKGKWKTFKKAKGIRVTAKLKKISIRAIDNAGNVSKAKKVKVKAKWRR
ncbi:hypothetical protein GCM10010401_13650 [Rarobacter faecitabidus]|uniref:Uncharacterized protein n=1 Tax=Rarobacter faecitabidus TaxID=13243 RepID=A0A542ZE48_RARFA|nr:hypothetical protein [Rarobacter faecitabidus]TQL58587.1 hypothetical protein FB461_2002 [Rarobacter faecitabidus]